MINFEEFQEYVRTSIPELLPENLKNGEIRISEVEKNNDVILHGLCISPQNSNIEPIIYLEKYFEMYENGASLNEVMSCIVKCAMEKEVPTGFENIAEDFRDFDFVKDKIVIAVVNTAKCVNLLKKILHHEYEDLSFIYKVVLRTDDHGTVSITIRNEHLAFWGVTAEEIHEIAMENSKKVLPASVNTLREITENIVLSYGMADCLKELMLDLSPRKEMYLITNTARVNGASAIFYKNVLSNLAEQVETDLYILPSSIHECIAVSTEIGTPELFANMVRDINESQLPPEELLSDNVYYYNASTNELRLAV